MILITIPVLVAPYVARSLDAHGKAMRATAQDRDASAMMGINVNRTISFTFVLAGGLAGAAGVLFLLQFNMRYDTGFELGLIAFTAAVLGGIGNLAGAMLGGLLIGFIQEFNEGLTIWSPGGDWTRSIVFGILIAILVFRPDGPARRADAGGRLMATHDAAPTAAPPVGHALRLERGPPWLPGGLPGRARMLIPGVTALAIAVVLPALRPRALARASR